MMCIKKMNNRGFMMAEVIVVSAIALIVLASLYISYGKIYGIYRTRISYNDVNSLNRLAFFRDVLIEDCDNNDTNCKLNKLLTDTTTIKNITDDIKLPDTNVDVGDGKLKSETTFLYHNGKNNFDEKIFTGITVNQTYREYVNYLNTSATFDSNYVMLIERCYDDDNCKYAYLEIYDGSEG